MIRVPVFLVPCLAGILAGIGGFATEADEKLISNRDRFDAVITAAVDATVAKPGDKEAGGIAWREAYQLDALVTMLEATGDEKYAAQIVKLSDWASAARDDRMGLRDEVRGSILPGWSTTYFSKGQRYIWAVHTGMIAAPMARFAAVVRNDQALAARWTKDADRILVMAGEAVTIHDKEYREGPGLDEGYMYCPYLKKNLPLNMQNALARAWLAIDDATGKPLHRERISRIARFMKNRLRVMDGGSCVWAYWPPLEGVNETYEDISHAAINVDFAILCFEHDIVFTREDLARFETTLTKRIWLADDRISDTVGGGEKINKYREAVLRWARLARHFPEERDRFLQLSRMPEFSSSATSLPLALALLSLPKFEPGKR